MILNHVNTFILVQCLSLLIASGIYCWKNAYLKLNKSKKNTSTNDKIRESLNSIGKMGFVFCITVGIAWTIDFIIL